MFGLFSRFLGNFFLYTCLASMIFVFLSLAGLIRFLPRFLAFLPRVLRVVLILSFRLYALLISWFSPLTEALFRLRLYEGMGRLTTCVFFSACFGSLFLWLFDLPFAWWSVGIVLLHGVTVSLAWEEIQQPGTLQLGERIR